MNLTEHRNIGYLLHPSITDKLPESPVIADIGTGTGIFLSHLAKVYSKATLRGFDISPDLFPAPESLPFNVELGIMNIKEPPPSEEHNRYDVVHVRLLTVAMNPTDWDLAVRNVTRLLKPGGALQWVEGKFSDMQYLRGTMDLSVSATRLMISHFQKTLMERISSGWNMLPQIMRSAGFLAVDEDVVSSDRVVETRQALTANVTGAAILYARLRVKLGAADALHEDELKRLEDQVSKDINSGSYARFDLHIAVGFTPVD